MPVPTGYTREYGAKITKMLKVLQDRGFSMGKIARATGVSLNILRNLRYEGTKKSSKRFCEAVEKFYNSTMEEIEEMEENTCEL